MQVVNAGVVMVVGDWDNITLVCVTVLVTAIIPANWFQNILASGW